MRIPNRPYGRRWQRARKYYLQRNAWCVYCERAGRLTVAEVVDHIKPHRGNAALFWDQENWQALCKRCHDSDKQSEEKAPEGCDEMGFPKNGDW